MSELLIDSMPLTFSLEEAADKPGKVILRGQFAKSGVATDNKRVYKENLWRREFGRLGEAMGNRRVYGELDHPADGRTKLQRVSHLITSLQVQGNEVIGEAEVLNTPNGRIIKALAEAKAQVGVSSRGYGTTKTLPDGNLEVQEDFNLHTFDFVADPATKTAYPKVFAEERQLIQEAEVELTLENLKANYPGLVQELTDQLVEGTNGGGSVARAITEAEQRTEERLTQQFSEQLRRGMEVIEEEATASVRSELMSDPEVAGARQTLEQVVSLVRSYGIDPEAKEQLMSKEEDIETLRQKLSDRELEVQKYKAEAEEMKKLAKEAAYKLHLERAIGKDPSREAIESLVGDVTQFESREALDERITAIRAELERRGGPVTTEGDTDSDDDKDEIIAELEARVESANEELQRANKAKKGAVERAESAEKNARKAVEIAEGLEIQLYVEQKVGSFPAKDRDSLRELCEDAVDCQAIDRIVERFVPQRVQDDDEVDRIRARVQRGKPRDLQEDTHGHGGPNNGKGSSPLEEVGLDADNFNKLAGTSSGA
jgi:hypothetical protein